MDLSKKQSEDLLKSISIQKWSYTKLSDACTRTLEIAEKEDIHLTFAVLDKGGHLVFLYRHPKALFISLELAQKKAYSSFAMQMDTELIQNLTQPAAPLYQLEASMNGALVSFAGGIWLNNDHLSFSAIGVSGTLNPKDDARFATLFQNFL